MPDIFLTQQEADHLLSVEKLALDDNLWEIAGQGDNYEIPLTSVDNREYFSLDIWSSGKLILKGRYQNRARSTVILSRLDFGGQPHRNPDDTIITSPHIHIYKEGFADKWAYPLPLDDFPDQSSLRAVLDDYMKYCNITKVPRIISGLWV